jgi:hypothetical protein
LVLGGVDPSPDEFEEFEEFEEFDPFAKFATSWPMRFSSTSADCVKSISSLFLR